MRTAEHCARLCIAAIVRPRNRRSLNEPNYRHTHHASVRDVNHMPNGARAFPNVQHYVCNAGHTQAECHERAEVLRATLKTLSHRKDWKRILSDRNLSSDIPAMTDLSRRETLFDDALLKRSRFVGSSSPPSGT
jgi:hypothetical protein